MEKRISCRAIIFTDNQMILMYREKGDKIYYAIPGGGLDDGETHEQCVKRELIEEFGITVSIIKKLYTYEDNQNIHHYYLCKWESGEFGTGVGEEFTDHNKKGGLYIPKMMKIDELKDLPIVPPEVKQQILLDLEKYGINMNDNETNIVGNF